MFGYLIAGESPVAINTAMVRGTSQKLPALPWAARDASVINSFVLDIGVQHPAVQWRVPQAALVWPATVSAPESPANLAIDVVIASYDASVSSVMYTDALSHNACTECS